MMTYEQTQFWRPGLQWAETDTSGKRTVIGNQAHKSHIFICFLYLLMVYSSF